MSVFLLLMALTGACWNQAQGSLKLASYYSDHMVLQRGPQQAILWGTADTEGDTVTAEVEGHCAAVTTTVQNGKWKIKLPAITDPGPFDISISSKDGTVTLHDVLFGDVWLCSGQSNMEFAMGKIMNSTAEVENGLGFNTIRFLKASMVQSNTPLEDLTVAQPWTAPTRASLKQFSAVCFLFAEYLQPHLKYPLGLVGTYWGGTTIEVWSPSEAIRDCQLPEVGSANSNLPRQPEILWNAMVFPLLPMTINGVLWYQGESNSAQATEYACRMKALVREWRKQFNQESLGQTRPDFPFGYVQIGPTTNVTFVGNFPVLRWAQTANYGYSPNPDLPNTFMTVAMDLPDFKSPYGAIHPRYKQDVAHRLVRGALYEVYGFHDVLYQGPFPCKFTLDGAGHSLAVQYKPNPVINLSVRNSRGFDVCCSKTNTSHPKAIWIPAPIVSHNNSHVTLDGSGCTYNRHVVGVRYEWRQTPCDTLRGCAVYDGVSTLPAPPFLYDLTTYSPNC